MGVTAGLLATATLVARSGLERGAVVDALADSAVGRFAQIALLGWVVARARRTPWVVVTVLAGGLALAATWSLAIGRSPLDPTGVGVVGSPGSSTVLVASLGFALFGWGVALGTGRLAIPLSISPVPPIAVLAPITAAAVLAGAAGRSVGIVASSAAALAWPVVLARPRAPRRALPTRTQLCGAALGLTVAPAGAFDFLARRYVERVTTIDGTVRLTGPLTTAFLWTAMIAASVGVVAATAAVIARELGRGSWRFRLDELLVAVVPLAFLLRIATLVNIVTARRDGGDPFFYHVTANLLAEGRGFLEPVQWTEQGVDVASALHGPAFPVALSFWSRLGGTSYVDHQLASIVLGVPQVVFGIVLAHRLAGGRAAVLAAVSLLAYPNIWITDGSLFVEGMMAGATTAATWMIYQWRDEPSMWRIGVIGALVGVAALTRGEALLLVPLLICVVLAWRVLPWRRRLAHAAVGTAACVVTLLPWMIYNVPRFDVFVPLSTNGNEVLFYANCDDTYSGRAIGFWSFACQERFREQFGDPPGDRAEQAIFWREQGLDYMRDHRDQVPKVVAARVGRQWELFRPWQTVDFGFIEGRPRRPLQLGLAMYYGMMAFAVVGSWALRRRRLPIWPLWCHAVAVTLTAIYAYGTLRFRAPFEPILCVMAAVGAVALWDVVRGHPGPVDTPVDEPEVAA